MMTSKLAIRLIEANENGLQGAGCGDIFYEAAERIYFLERRRYELKDIWHQLVVNTTEKDVFGNVTIAKVDFDAIDKFITGGF